MSSTELPRHIVDRFERRWAKKLEQQARAWKSARSESRSLTIVAPAAIERAMSVFEQFKDRDHCELSQARKALRDFVFGQVAKGGTDKKRLVVSGLTHLKQLEKQAAK